MNAEPSQQGSTVDRRFLVTTLVIVVAMVLFLLALLWVGSRIETLEDELGFTPANQRENDALAPTVVSADATRHAVYVPVYSHIYARGGRPYLLETTLSLRNTDPKRPIAITRVAFFDTTGNLVHEHMDEAMSLGPLASAEFLVAQRDTGGGSGANFIVEWAAEDDVNEPIIEAVMVGIEGQRGISFTRSGVRISG